MFKIKFRFIDWHVVDSLDEALEYVEDLLPEEYVDDYIDDYNDEIEIFGLKYKASAVLREIDPIYYREVQFNFLDEVMNEIRQNYEDYDKGDDIGAYGVKIIEI